MRGLGGGGMVGGGALFPSEMRVTHYILYRAVGQKVCTAEAEFLDEIWTKVLRVFLLVINSHLY
jgi:hypothetical protein